MKLTVARRGYAVAFASLLVFAAFDHVECPLERAKISPLHLDEAKQLLAQIGGGTALTTQSRAPSTTLVHGRKGLNVRNADVRRVATLYPGNA